MNRENKRKTFEKGYYKTLYAGKRRQRPPQPLPQLSQQSACGYRTR